LSTTNGLSHVRSLFSRSCVICFVTPTQLRTYVTCVSHREMWVTAGIGMHADCERRVRECIIIENTNARVRCKMFMPSFLGMFHARVQVMNKIGY